MMRSWRMRTMLLLSLAAVVLIMTVLFLGMVRMTVERQVRGNLELDMRHSLQTFHNLQQQRQQLLLRESSLLSELPSLKAVMTTSDSRTIADAGAEFWSLSGNDFFSLQSPEGRLEAYYNSGSSLTRQSVEAALRETIDSPELPRLFVSNGRLFEISSRALTFGSGEQTTGLGYVTIGYALDDKVAREVSEAAAAEVVFVADGRIVAGTLSQALRQKLASSQGELLRRSIESEEMKLGGERYLASSVQLQPETPTGGAIHLVVFKSFGEKQQILARLNRMVIILGLLAALFGVALAVYITRTVTRPLESLVAATRALSGGDFTQRIREQGAEEVRELSRAFDRMRGQMQTTQQELLAAERMATIGQMANSVSHDLRHYLSAIYANAEFLADPRLPGEEREELLEDVRAGVQGMTDMLDSLLVFSRTGMALHLQPEPLAALIERTVGAIRSHPEARGVERRVIPIPPVIVEVDSKELRRAVYNLLLNACQAAGRGETPPWVSIEAALHPEGLRITVRDSGPGVPAAIRDTLFHPFVSEGKQSGVGLGLALAKYIAEAHGGSIYLEDSESGNTAFTIALPSERILEEVSCLATEER
ncbi:MAG: HAMP domain-containing sensor histidine kinase [Terracidiphilus sp.]